MKNIKKTAALFVLYLNLLFSYNIQAQAPVFEWAKSVGGISSDRAKSITTDNSGNVYTIGDFKGTVDFDPGPGTFNLTNSLGYGTFILKLDANGNFLWAKQIEGINVYGNSITTDNSGNVYATGSFFYTVDFDPGPGTNNLISNGNKDIYILKLDSGGNFLWVKQIGEAGDEEGQCITRDNSGNLYITGRFTETVDFDPGTGTANLNSNGIYDIFILKLDANGNFLWAKNPAGVDNDMGYSITTDNSGNVYATGRFKETVDFDPGPGTFNLNSNGSYDAFILKLDANGNFLWAKSIGGAEYEESKSITTDANGNVYTTGDFQGTVDFDPGPGTFNITSYYNSSQNQYSLDGFIQKLDASGNFLWVKRIGSFINGMFKSITTDKYGGVYTTGLFYYTVDFDPGPGTFNISDSGGGNIFILKLDTSGNFLWVNQMGGPSIDYGYAITIDDCRNIYTTGIFGETADFDPGTGTANLTSNGSRDIFIQKLGDCIILPVELVSFKGECNGLTVELNWSTISEINNDFFTIEKSLDGEIYFSIGTIQGQGNSSNLTSYSFIDDNTSKQPYYRLKQTDFNGETNYHSTISVFCNKDSFFKFYPNPVKDELTITLSKTGVYTVEIKDYLGRLVLSESIPNNDLSHKISLNSLHTKGIYFAFLRNKQGKIVASEKILKQ